MQNLNKISFTGDILCDFPEIKYMKKNQLNFDDILKKFEKKDDELLIGNLETPICEKLPYTYEEFSFNSPVNFLKMLKNYGFDILSVANNHCLDRGNYGALNTIKNVKNMDILPVGVYLKDEINFDIYNYKGIKIAFIAYTYGTNYLHNYCLMNNKIKINILKEQTYNKKERKNKFEYCLYQTKQYIKYTNIGKKISKIKNYSKKNNGVKAYIVDDIDNLEWKIDKKYLIEIENTVKKAKKQADVVIFLLHSGGQFNSKVGSFTYEIAKYITQYGVDLIIGNHPHIVQKYEIINGKPVFFSLGNFLFSPSSSYVNFNDKPEYSIKVNTYWKNKKIFQIKYEILKNVENILGHTQVYNTYDYSLQLDEVEKKKLLEDCNFIANKIKDTEKCIYITELKREYEI